MQERGSIDGINISGGVSIRGFKRVRSTSCNINNECISNNNVNCTK